MTYGILYGIGVGPGDSELITVKAARILGECRHVFAPRPRKSSVSTSLEIARPHMRSDARVHAIHFPMTGDPQDLQARWRESAHKIATVLKSGEDACYLTLGDALLYSTYVYLLRSLREILPDAEVVTVPGITAFSAVGALTEFPLGEGNDKICIIPAGDDIEGIKKALSIGGTVIVMKIGKRLHRILDLLESENLLDRGVLVARAGMEGQRIETDLRKLKQAGPEAGNLSIILVHAGKERAL